MKTSRFTLIELLTVITIITVLSAILLPALQTSRALAVRIKCLNNVKQLFLTFSNYADDYGGYILPHRMPAGGSGNPWLCVAQDYFKLPQAGDYYGAPVSAAGMRSITVCPTQIAPAVLYYKWPAVSYRDNYSVMTDVTSDYKGFINLRRLSWLRFPSKTMALWCGFISEGGNTPYPWYTSYNDSNILLASAYRHKSSSNLLLFDGSVLSREKFKSNELGTLILTGTK